MRTVHRYLGLVVLLAMAVFAAVGFFSIRRGVDNLKVISQDNILWSATQMEVELLRFKLSIADLALEQSKEALDDARDRFDILWSRIFMMSNGRVGQLMREYDDGHGSLQAIGNYLQIIDPVLAELNPVDGVTIERIIADLDGFQKELRLYTLRVVRYDTAATAQVRESIQSSAQTTAVISLAAVLISVLSLGLILREAVRQRELAEMSRRSLKEAEQASRAKSRFLSMMSHELRNPLNGVLGPLALLDQSHLATPQRRLVGQVRNCGQSMLQMLSGMLDYAEIQDGRFVLASVPFQPRLLAASVAEALDGQGGAGPAVAVTPGTPVRMTGDPDRLRQVIVHLSEYVLEATSTEKVAIRLGHDGGNLTADIRVSGRSAAFDWKMDLLAGLDEVSQDQVAADALRPLIARGILSASGGVMALEESGPDEWVISVAVPAEVHRLDRLRIRIESRSAALSALYRAALKSDQVEFDETGGHSSVDVVLVDSTSAGGQTLLRRLRGRYPEAVLISMGSPENPDLFDDIIPTANDMGGLRSSVYGQIAS